MNSKRIFLATVATAMTLGAAHDALAQSGGLTLYGVDLKNAKVPQFVAAAKAAGAKATGDGPAFLSFDVAPTGVPALKTLVVLFSRDSLVAAQFNVVEHGAENETLRKMLKAKYGPPQVVSDWSAGSKKFDEVYLSDGTYTWKFAGGMTLTFKNTHMKGTTLTYADAGKLKALTEEVEGASKKDAGAKAEKLGKNF